MADFAPNALSRWVAGENTLGRRFFIESCAGAVVAGMAAQAAPAQTVAAVPANFFPFVIVSSQQLLAVGLSSTGQP